MGHLGSCSPLTIVKSGVRRSTGLPSGPEAAESWRKLVAVDDVETCSPSGAVTAQIPGPCGMELGAIQGGVARAPRGHTAHQELGTVRPPRHELEWPHGHEDHSTGHPPMALTSPSAAPRASRGWSPGPSDRAGSQAGWRGELAQCQKGLILQPSPIQGKDTHKPPGPGE